MPPNPTLDASHWQLVLDHILVTAKTQEPPPVRRLIPWTRAVVAAAFIGLLIAGASLWTHRQNNTIAIKQPVAARSGDIRPAGNRATLALASGATIILGSVQNGPLSRQGNTTIIKSGKGQLGYHLGESQSMSISYNTLTTSRAGCTSLFCPTAPGSGLMPLRRSHIHRPS
jgi:hypothetical protein